MNKLEKTDYITAVSAVFLLLVLGFLSLTSGLPHWGDDNAAYISEGIAIAEGKLPEQTIINYYCHPSDMPREAMGSESVVYVWGYPLELGIIYMLFGFDPSDIILYKIPDLISLSLLSGVLVLFLRRRFSLILSLISSLMICLSSHIFDSLNNIYSDISFLFLSMLSILLMELFVERTQEGKKANACGIFYSIVLWFTYETRLSGIGLMAAVIVSHVIAFSNQRGCDKDKKQRIVQNFSPYLITLSLILISERIFLAVPTQNFSDLHQEVDLFSNMKYYYELFLLYFDYLIGNGYMLYILFLLGLITHGWKKENIAFSFFIFGTIAVNLRLPYVQGLRYVYNILPLVIMYCLYGLKVTGDLIVRLWRCISTKYFSDSQITGFVRSFMPKLCVIIAVCFIILKCAYPVSRDIENLTNRGYRSNEDVYSDEALEVYRYIKEETSDDSIVAFDKPRMIYLNTGHLSFRDGVNGRELSEADYYLLYKHHLDGHIDVVIPDGADAVLDNSSFTLYWLR